MLQNLPYFMKTKPKVAFSIFISCNFIYLLNDQGIHYGKEIKVARNGKSNFWFSFHKNIANFEGFWGVKNFSKNLLFLRSAV